jgi:hypothetical protein
MVPNENWRAIIAEVRHIDRLGEKAHEGFASQKALLSGEEKKGGR